MRLARMLLVAAVALCAGVPAAAEVNQDGDLLVFFDGAMSPTALPRKGTAPVSVRVAGDFRSASGNVDALPQLRTISVAINRQGRLFDRGLPVCRPSVLRSGTEQGARERCGGAVVGEGHVRLRVRLPAQAPFTVKAKLLVFNGPRDGGRKLLLAQAYSRKPPGEFILVFRLSRRPGVFGTVMSTTLPRSAWDWAYLTHFDMRLRRTYRYGGERRSYVSAGCATAPGFRGASFPFARATYRFADGRAISVSTTGMCTVKAG